MKDGVLHGVCAEYATGYRLLKEKGVCRSLLTLMTGDVSGQHNRNLKAFGHRQGAVPSWWCGQWNSATSLFFPETLLAV